MMKGNIKKDIIVEFRGMRNTAKWNQSCIIGEIIIMPKFSKVLISKYFVNDDGYMDVNLKETNWFQSLKLQRFE